MFSTLFFHGGFLRDEERSLGFWVGGYFVMIHAFIGGFLVSPDVAWIEIKSLFYRDYDFSWTMGLEYFQTHLAGFSLPYLSMH